jgi:hypothetical protein
MPFRFCAFIVLLLLASAGPFAQSTFQFIVAARDGSGTPVTDLKAEEVVMSENGAPARIARIEPFSLPVKVTLAVDNGRDSREALAYYRTGLKGLVEALPADVEMTLITTAPQPRTVVRPTKDRAQVQRGIDTFAPDDEPPRFTDALVEYSERLDREMRDKKGAEYVPVLVMISTTGAEASSTQLPTVEKALKVVAARRARVFVTVTTPKAGDATASAGITTTRQFLIASPLVKATAGRLEALTAPARLAMVLPEIGSELAALQRRLATQFRVTVERPGGASGPLQNPRVELIRPGLTGAVSLDGFLQ